MQTIGSRLDANNGIAPGFDFMRLFLATSVVAWHVSAIVTGDLSYVKTPIVWMLGYYILAGFFSLSGFLIAASALRLSLKNFLVNRALRIVPALAVEVCLSALILGPIFTTLPLADYAADPATRAYFANVIGWIHYVLPGVFKDHHSDIVNNTLWTVPHEFLCYFGCYALVTLLIALKLQHRPWPLFVIAFAIGGIGMALAANGIDADSKGGGRLLYMLFVGRASRLYVCFLFGMAIYLMRHRIPYDRRLLGAALAICLGVGALPMPAGTDYPLANLLIGLPMAYITAWLGATRLWTPKFLHRGDYSYGIYLYGWPIQQMLVALLPGVTSLWVHLALALPLVFAFAVFSWHFIERPILDQRRRFSFVARVRLDEDATAAATRAA